jgi:hypothetical protein
VCEGVYAFAFFGGTIASFADLATRNFTTFFAAILRRFRALPLLAG